MSDRARGLAEETLAKLILCVDGIEPMDADAADTAHGIIEEALRTAEQHGYDAGLSWQAYARSLIGSSPAPDTDRDERLARWFVLRENPDILPSLLDHVVKRDLARFRESEANRTEAK